MFQFFTCCFRYNPDLNPIENLFSQLKNYIRNKSPDNYNELKLEIDKTFINKIKEIHLKNYFNNLFLQADEYIKKHKK
jgi:transposase